MNDNAFMSAMAWFGLISAAIGFGFLFFVGFPELANKIVAMGVLP